MNAKLRVCVMAAIGIVGFGIWSYMVYLQPELRTKYLDFVINAVSFVLGLALRDMQPAGQAPQDPPRPAPPAPSPQPLQPKESST